MAPKEYKHEGLVVSYDAEVCIHAAECVRGLPKVFDPNQRPWIQLQHAAADAVEQVVARCPSGALKSRRDQATAPPTTASVTVRALPDGPLIVEGGCRVVDASGAVLADGPKVALCRCGQSGKKPFCDGTHSRAGFKAP